jgi:3',5'-cyclic AMP phosphodiesterase CpdA
MPRKLGLLLLCVLLCLTADATAQVVVAQLSDMHIGWQGSAEATSNLRRALEMVNARHPDAVIVSGDIGETTAARRIAQKILGGLNAPIYYVPGNHDESADTVKQYRAESGKNYYEFNIKGLTFLAVDSQLLGNFDVFESREVMALSSNGQAESEKMFSWLDDQARELPASTDHSKPAPPIFVVQHVPISRDGNFPNDPKPYWTIQEPYRTREIELLHRLGVKHVFVGHWHAGRVYEADGITYHVAPSTTRSLFGDPLGFAIHTITPDGNVKTEFVYLQ